MLRSSAPITRPASILTASTALLALCGSLSAGPVLENHSTSLTTYKPSSATTAQDILPQHLQRGTNIDGTLRASPFFRWALAGNPFGEQARSAAKLGDLQLASGTYAPTIVDLHLPADGAGSWPIGRTYSFGGRSGASHRDSNGPQGYNWHQASQPEIILYDDATDTEDMVYLVYGADRFAEFKRTATSATTYKGVNGAAGIFEYDDGSPDVWIYHDPSGTNTYFFGGNTASGQADWQIWKIVDAAGNTAYVGDASTASTAVTNGYTADGWILKAFDDAGRRYCYTYSGAAIGGTKRLTQVLVETDAGGGWGDCGTETTVATVEYAYYESDDSGKGKTGDLKLVTVTVPLSQSGVDSVKKTYYRYYTTSWSNADGSRGEPHAIKMVVDAEGYRARDWAADSDLTDNDPQADSDATLQPYSSAYLEYVSASDDRVSSAFFNGECGCSGGNAGTHSLAYSTNGSFSGTSGYDTAWHSRVVITQPDGIYATQYLDETGQALSGVVTDAAPSGAYTDWWATKVVRNGDGQVTAVHTPANTSAYTHSTGALTSETSTDLVNVIDRIGGSDFDKGLPEAARYKEGDTAASVYYTGFGTYTSRAGTVGSATLDRPLTSARRAYHTAGTSSGTTANYDETAYSYAFHSATATAQGYLAVKSVTTTLPAVTTANNGSNTSNTIVQYLRADGTVAFTKAADGVYTYTQYTNGRLVKKIEDCQTNHASDFVSGDDPNTNFGISESADGLRLITTYTYDAQGRLETTTLPSGRVMRNYYDKLADGRLASVAIPREVAGGSTTYYGPASYSVWNLAGKMEFQGTVAISASGITTALSSWIDGSASNPITALGVGTLERLRTAVHNSAGTRIEESRTYFSIPAAGSFPGTRGTHYDSQLYGYDDMGRQRRVKDETDTITRTTYDDLGRRAAVYVGTNDSSFAGGEASGTDNTVKTQESTYDSGSTAGNSHVTKVTLYVENSATDKRETSYTYDYRGRMLLATNPQSPHVFSKYDNLGRMIASGTFSSTASITVASDDPTTEATNRVGLSQTFYDELGRVWKIQRHKIDVADGSDDDNLQSLTWYDAAGRVIKVDGEQLAKTAYDRLGRVTHRFTLAVDNDSAYTDADDVTGDTVLEEHQTTYEIPSGTVIMQAVIKRLHNDFGVGATTGALDTNADADRLKHTAANIEGRIQITSMWYDDLDRLTDTVLYGTNSASGNAADFDREPSGAYLTVPARSDTELRTSYSYDTTGNLQDVTDPKGIITRTTYDQAGRKIAVTENYVGSGGTSTNAIDRCTRYTYNDGLMTELWLDMDADGTYEAGDQKTVYTYGVTTADSPGASKFASNRLLRKIVYPGAGADTDRDVWLAYNAQEHEIYRQDQTGTVIETVFDTAGRETHRRATTTASGIETSVLRISTAYNSRGQVETVTQYNNATVGSGSVVDEVKYTYSDWGPVSNFEQDHNSTVGTGSDDYEVTYTYGKATTGRNTVYRSGMTQVYGSTTKQTLTYEYLSTSGSQSLEDAKAARVTTIKIGTGSPVLIAEYRYLGAGDLVETYLAEPDSFTRVHDGGGTPTYPDRDRFERVTRSRWTKDLATDRDFYDVQIAYDPNSNITRVEDNILVSTAGSGRFDASYTIDDLNRLTRAEEGHWGGSSISTRTRDERWQNSGGTATLGKSGNWTNHRLDLNGDAVFTGTGELDQSNTFSDANELTARDKDSSGGAADYDLVYNKRGDLTDDDEFYKYTYDAFGRLIGVKNTATEAVVAQYSYNGLGFRTSWKYDTDADNDVDASDQTYRFAYDEQWRVVATYRGSDTSPKEQFVFHNAGDGGFGGSSYIDTAVLRDKDANAAWPSASDGTLEQRYYYCQNWRADVSAILKSDGSGVVEYVKYSAYGVPTVIPRCDVDHSGAVDATDSTVWNTIYTAGLTTYSVQADYDLDGSVKAADNTAFSNDHAATPTAGRGRLSSNKIDSRIGYAGYQWDPAIKMYHVRHRIFDPHVGRWTRRDPLGYVDGMGLYQYTRSLPLVFADMLGLAPERPNPGDDGGCGSGGGVIDLTRGGPGECDNPGGPPDGGGDDDGGGDPPAPPTCKAEICCKGVLPISGGGSGPARHCYLKCTRGQEVRACSANPTGFFWDLYPVGTPTPNDPPPCRRSWTIFDGAWGPIDTYCGPHVPGHPDYGSGHTCETIATGQSACNLCSCTEALYARIDSCCIGYELLGPNSNSTLYTALSRCGDWVIPSPPGGNPIGWGQDVCRGRRCCDIVEH